MHEAAGGQVSLADRLAPYTGWVRLVSLTAIVGGLLLIAAALPVEQGLRAVTAWIEGFGAAGPLVYAGVYLLITVLMVPAAPFSIAAGALFGLGWGMLAVWLGANVGAALALLIARYLARGAVERKLAGLPKFRAVDRAVAEGGWKIVALLRLSPAVPFNLQNYLYGLTGIRFWACVGATAVAMLPGIFLYVYLGYAGRAGLEAAAAGEVQGGWGQWALLIIGLIATLAVTIYITRLARRAIAKQTALGETEAAPTSPKATDEMNTRHPAWGRTIVTAALALVVIAAAACAQLRPQWLTQWFGPPAVTMTEVYEDKPGGPTFDHSRYAAILEQHVNENGGVNYEALMEKPNELLAYNASLAKAPFDEMGRNEKLALLLNAYNSFTLELMIEWLPRDGIDGIRDIPADRRWKDERWNIGGHIWSLDQIEHEQIRAHFVEPSYHFAAVCAAVGCPPLRREPYTGAKLDEQLHDQAEIVHTDGTRWFQYDRNAGAVHLTPLYQWYASDFKQVKSDVLQYAAQYNDVLAEALQAGERPRIHWLEYDWSLNDQENLP